MNIINTYLLDKVTEDARNDERLRMNYNFHHNLDAKAQRLLNALEPGTKLPIHRHVQTDETYILLRGRIRILFYNDNKNITEVCELNPLEGNFGVHIPAGQWHTLEVLESGSVIFEVKDGPYTPLTPENMME